MEINGLKIHLNNHLLVIRTALAGKSLAWNDWCISDMHIKVIQKIVVIVIFFKMMLPTLVLADWKKKYPDVEVVGSGVLKVFFMDIYNLTLHATTPNFTKSEHYILEFNYKKPVSKTTIIDASINELTKVPNASADEIKAWRGMLDKGIVDMNSGDKAAVVFSKLGEIEFWSKGRKIASFTDPRFTTNFAAIWLGPKTVYPELRMALLGQKSSR